MPIYKESSCDSNMYLPTKPSRLERHVRILSAFSMNRGRTAIENASCFSALSPKKKVDPDERIGEGKRRVLE